MKRLKRGRGGNKINQNEYINFAHFCTFLSAPKYLDLDRTFSFLENWANYDQFKYVFKVVLRYLHNEARNFLRGNSLWGKLSEGELTRRNCLGGTVWGGIVLQRFCKYEK